MEICAAVNAGHANSPAMKLVIMEIGAAPAVDPSHVNSPAMEIVMKVGAAVDASHPATDVVDIVDCRSENAES
jgi:hypothetical protein